MQKHKSEGLKPIQISKHILSKNIVKVQDAYLILVRLADFFECSQTFLSEKSKNLKLIEKKTNHDLLIDQFDKIAGSQGRDMSELIFFKRLYI